MGVSATWLGLDKGWLAVDWLEKWGIAPGITGTGPRSVALVLPPARPAMHAYQYAALAALRHGPPALAHDGSRTASERALYRGASCRHVAVTVFSIPPAAT